ncbi:type III pantothenate kinase [Candidatus Soleaferrea massiliensis]|uniref:type III pantothenate kinase n=1 Tax=Candidatus Soleaferrea massiliensis TaxID=1470354 RepID=UPI00058EAE29|nr:type III pantothenate kinase [Candidatus Soleaferrea massiliensis]
MLLAIDIGNTNMEFGVFEDDRMLTNFRLGTNRDITSDEVGLFTSQFFTIQQIDMKSVQDIIITSVVPQVMYSITNAMRKYFDKEPLIVGDNIKLDIVNKYDNPKEVGADRLVNAIIAYKKYGGPVIVVDFGTATTFDAVDETGAYLGGSIYPGIKISADALFQKTSKLPRIELLKPEHVIGLNTIESMQSGILYGYAGAVKNIVDMISREFAHPESVKVIATGGLSKMIGTVTGIFDAIDKRLTLEGLKLIYDDCIHKLDPHR